MNDIMPNGDTHEIPGWDRPKWAVRGVRYRDELVWQRQASVDVIYDDHGVEATFAPKLIRVDQVTIGETGVAVHMARPSSCTATAAPSRPMRRGSWRRHWSSSPITPTVCDDCRRDADRRPCGSSLASVRLAPHPMRPVMCWWRWSTPSSPPRRPTLRPAKIIDRHRLLSARPRPHRSRRGPPQSAAGEHLRQPAEGEPDPRHAQRPGQQQPAKW
jgi:hypothetical protein